MSKYPKLEQFTKEDLLKQLEEGEIDTDFLLDYIVKRDEVYNKLIDRINELEERQDKAIEFINHPWKFECSDEDCNVLIHNRKRFLLGILRGAKDENN